MSDRKTIAEDIVAIAGVYDATGKSDQPIKVRCALSTLHKIAARPTEGFARGGFERGGGKAGSSFLRSASADYAGIRLKK